MKIIFSNLSEIYYAFFKFNSSLEPEVKKLTERIIRKLKLDENAMGFALKRDDDDLESKILRILEEYDPNYPPEKLNGILQYIKDKRESDRIKQRTLVQTIVTFLLLPILFFLLNKQGLDQTTKEAIIGFLGIIIGYWLR